MSWITDASFIVLFRLASTTEKIDLSPNFLPTFKHFVQDNILETGNKFEIRMNRYYVTSNESKSKNAGSSFFFFLFFYQYRESEIGSWKLEFPLTFFAWHFVSIVWTSNEIKYCPALTMNVKNNRGWCRNFKLDLMKYTRNISVNFSMGMNGIVIFMYRMVQWIYIKKMRQSFSFEL